MKRAILYLIVLFFLVLGVFYQFFGGRYWLQLSDLIASQESAEKRAELGTEIWGKEGTEYGGVIMGVDGKGVWLWGKKGPKFFTDKEKVSVYYFYDTCSAENLEKAAKKKNVSVAQDIYFDIKVWKQKVKTGQYALIRYLPGKSGQLKEIWGYGYWYFSNKGLIDQCNSF